MKRVCALCLLASLIAGCESLRPAEYHGPQIWPVSKSATANTDYSVPVYFNWPGHPFRVLGSINTGRDRAEWLPADTARAALIARSYGGDALMIRVDTNCLATLASCRSPGISREQVWPLVLKWKSSDEVDEESHRLDGLRAYLRRSYPELHIEAKHELWETGVEYVASLGLDINSRPGSAKMDEVMARLLASNTQAGSSQWLFKGNLSAKSSGGLPIEHTFYGVATLTRTGESVSLILDSDEISLVLTGRADDEHLRGESKLTLYSTTTVEQFDATFLPAKILAQTHNTPLRWNFLFLR